MAAAPPHRHVPDWVVLALACTAQFMVVLDVSIVNVALPSIGRDLHYSATGLQWVVNAYVLTFAGFLLLGGRAADLFGRKAAYLSGLGLFTLTSLAGGLAPNSTWLTTARAVQGIGGALLSPATLTIVVTTFTGPRMAKALGVWSAVGGAGGAAGVLLGGVLTAEFSWRWVLFVNLPVGVAAMAAATAWLSEVRRVPAGAGSTTEAADGAAAPGRPRLDVAGAVLVTLGLAVAVYAIVGTDTSGWGSGRTLGLLGGAGLALGAFAVVEARFAAAPLVPFRLFRSRSVSGANLVMLLVGAAFFSMWYFLSLYLQNVLGYGALEAGLAFFPMGLAIVVGAQVSGRVVNRVGARPLLLTGTLLAASGFAWMTRIGAHSGYWSHVFGPGCLVSFALGLLFTPLAATATAGVHHREAGLASGVLNTSRQIGGSLGLAILATIATDRTRSVATAAASSARGSTSVALSAGYARAFAVACGILTAAFAASLVVPPIGGRRGEASLAIPVDPAADGPAGGEEPRAVLDLA